MPLAKRNSYSFFCKRELNFSNLLFLGFEIKHTAPPISTTVDMILLKLVISLLVYIIGNNFLKRELKLIALLHLYILVVVVPV